MRLSTFSCAFAVVTAVTGPLHARPPESQQPALRPSPEPSPSLGSSAPVDSERAFAPAPSEPLARVEEEAPRKKVPHGFSAKVESGFGYRRLFDHPIYGGTATLAAGGELAGVFAIHGHFDAFVGRTDFGLDTRIFSFGPSLEAVIGRVRPGATLQIAAIELDRVSDDETIRALAWSAGGSLSVDLVQSPHANLALIARGRFFMASDAAVLPSFGLAVGGRFKVP